MGAGAEMEMGLGRDSFLLRPGSCNKVFLFLPKL